MSKVISYNVMHHGNKTITKTIMFYDNVCKIKLSHILGENFNRKVTSLVQINNTRRHHITMYVWWYTTGGGLPTTYTETALSRCKSDIRIHCNRKIVYLNFILNK